MKDIDMKQDGGTPMQTALARILRIMAVISALFAVLIATLLILNYIQLRQTDPLNTPLLKSLNEQLHKDPSNSGLQQEIRALDLLARKAYFTSQRQIRTGGYLLLGSLLWLIVCLKSLELITQAVPGLPQKGPENLWMRRKTERIWVVAAGMVLILVSLFLAWQTHRMLAPAGITMHVQPAPENTGNAAVNDTLTTGSAVSTVTADSLGITGESTPVAEGYPTAAEIRDNFITFRGPGGNGIAFGKNIPVSWDGASGKNIRWKTAIPLPGFNSPILWKDRLYLSGAKEMRKEIYCLDAISGKILWTTDVSAIPGTPSQVPKVIAETGQAAPTMTTDGRRVYAIFANGDLVALDMEGKMVWSKNLGLPKNHYGHSSSLIMYRDLLIVQYDQSGSGKVMAFRGATGEKAWETARNVKVSWASPVLVNTGSRMELILAAEPEVSSYDPATGTELWKLDCISGEVGPSVAYSDGMVFSVNEYSKLAAVRMGAEPALAWEDNEYLSDVPSPVAFNNMVFVVTSYGAVACYNAATGEKHWVKELDRSVYSSPMIAEGRLYILDKQGTMHILKAEKELSETGTAALGEGSFCTPVFGNGTIYIRANKNLYCIGK